MKEKITVLSGAGISAESGLRTFRDSGGLWEGHDIMEVASPEGWNSSNKRVLDFYNQRRKDAAIAKPNLAHELIAKLEDAYDVTVVTQNVDSLHEKAGSTHIIHLHGQLNESRSTLDPSLVYDIDGTELNLGDLCELGSQLRPNIVWFGEAVPLMDVAIEHAQDCSIFIVIGTSLTVYPAAGLIDFTSTESSKYIIDKSIPSNANIPNLQCIEDKATMGMQLVYDQLM